MVQGEEGGAMIDYPRTRPIMKSVTDDFVRAMTGDTTSVMAHMVIICGLPEGVDPEDQRVIEIVEAIERARKED